MKYWEILLFLLLMIINLSSNVQGATCVTTTLIDQMKDGQTEVTCEKEQLINVEIVIGHPGIDLPYKPGHVLAFRCTDVKMKLQGQQAVTCQSNGKWNHPFPKCQGVTCEGEQLDNVEIFIGHPEKFSPWRPGDILVFRCNNESLKMYGHQAVECQSNGKWNHPYPKCGEVTCDKEQLINVQIEYGYSDDVSNYKPGHVLYFECTDEKEMMYGHRVIECQSDGKWNHPYPTCGVSRKCGPPPYVNNAETVEMRKKEYNTGEKVEYKCFILHTLETHLPFSKYLTCQQGKWRGNVKCLKPCTVTVEMMNERGIEFAYPNKQKMFVPHNDHVTFRCQIICLRVRCNDGVMTLPECSFTHIFES